MHEVEVERRRSDRREMSDVKTEIEGVKVHIGSLLTFKNVAIGVSVFGMLVLTGSYSATGAIYYILDKQDQEQTQEVQKLERAIGDISDNVNFLKVQWAVKDTQYNTISGQLRGLEVRLTELVRKIDEDRSSARRTQTRDFTGEDN